jgi:hypothetical protein
VFTNLVGGAKIVKITFVVVTLKIQGYNKYIIRIYLSLLLEVLKAVRKFRDIYHQFVTKLNSEIFFISDHHMYCDNIKLPQATV